MLNVTVNGEKGTWNEKSYKSTVEVKSKIYVGDSECLVTKDEISLLRRFNANIKPVKPSTQETMRNSVCPKCGTYCYGDCEA